MQICSNYNVLLYEKERNAVHFYGGIPTESGMRDFSR